jgi:hypothetical protein
VLLLAASLAGAGLACSEEGDQSDIVYDWTLDECGFTEPVAATIDIAELSDVFHGDVVAQIEAHLRGGPSPTFHEVFMEQGGCRYYKSAIGVCDPPCASGEACDIDGECVAYPESLSGGKLTITGLGEKIEIEPEDWSPGTYLGPAQLPGQPFEAGTEIGASLAGADFPELALGALGIETMDTELTHTGYELLDGQDAEITWAPGPDPAACVKLVINGLNEVHGAPLSDIIVCEGTDSGSLVVPQAFVEEFPYGETPIVTEGYDWPHSELTRYTRNSVVTEYGLAELVVRSSTYFQPSHPEP